jgi:hypothetical protein
MNSMGLVMLTGRKATAGESRLYSGEQKTLHHCTLSGMMELTRNRALWAGLLASAGRSHSRLRLAQPALRARLAAPASPGAASTQPKRHASDTSQEGGVAL